MTAGSPIARALAASRATIASIGVFSCVINVLVLTGPLFMLQIYDRVMASRSTPTLIALAILVVVLYAFMGVLEAIRHAVLVRIGHRLDEIAGFPAFEAYVRAPLQRGPTAEAIRPIRDLDQVRQAIAGPGVIALFDLPWMPVYLGVLFVFHPVIGLVGIAGAVLLLAIAVTTEIASRGAAKDTGGRAQRRASLAEAGRRNIEVLQGMGMVGRFGALWRGANDAYLSSSDRLADIVNRFAVLSRIFRLTLQSGSLAVGAWLAINDQITAGTIVAASIIMSRGLQPIETVVSSWRSLITARESYGRLREFLSAAPATTPMTLPAPRRDVRAERLVVAAPGSERPILQGVEFRLEAGRALGVIGPMGCGKTTLARALVGVWPAKGGAVRIDGAPVEQWPVEDLGRHVGYLPQDVELFDGTVEENIGRFDPDRTPETVIAAARAAGVHDLVLSLPDGYRTRLGEQGAVLSAGQRQQVALARALYGDPFVVVLDEPNSNLDGAGDIALGLAVASVKKRGGVVILVTHRTASLQLVDDLLLLTAGRVTAYGPRNAVLEEVRRRSIAGDGKPVPIESREAKEA